MTHFMMGLWPFIERFPSFMALNLLKTRYGRSPGDDMARRWLVRNIRVEQNHAEYWLNWAAEGAGIPREKILHSRPPHGTQTLANWCEEISTSGTPGCRYRRHQLRYQVEGATGEWSQRDLRKQLSMRRSFPAKKTGAWQPALAAVACSL